MTRTLLSVALCLPLAGLAQTKLAFEAATIKPSAGDPFRTRIMLAGGAGGRYSASGLTIRQLIVQAYGLMDFQVTGGPGWISNDRFDIEASPGSGISPTQQQTQEMLQSLLEERFQLKIKRETKSMPGYSLVVAKGGPKMKLSADQTPPGQDGPAGLPPGAVAVAATRIAGFGGGPGGPAVQAAPPRGMIRMSPGGISGQAMPVSQIVTMLSRQLGRPVVDNTGLSGLYDVELNYTPDRTPPQGGLPPGVELPPSDPNGPTIFTALQEQLGLKLESTSQLGEMLTIERIEKPSEN